MKVMPARLRSLLPRRTRWPLVAVAACAAATALALPAAGGAPRAQAHPLGDFTVNHYDRIEVSEDGITVFSVLDMAEIPAFQERQTIDQDNDGQVDAAESAAYAERKAAELRSNLRLRIDGGEAALEETSRELTFPPGQGGLTTLRLEVTYNAALPGGWRAAPPRVAFEDGNDANKIGWREIVVQAGAGVAIGETDAPPEDLTQALTVYPEDRLQSPPDVRATAFTFAPGAGVARPSSPLDVNRERAARGNPDSSLARFAGLIAEKELGFGVVALPLLAAAGFGALHALSPGHGKTVVAAYLVGSRGTARHALLLGLVVTATHTSTVYALGFVTLYLSEYILPETLYPWLGIASGALIVAMGLSLFAGRLRSSGLLKEARSWLRSRAGARPGVHGAQLTLATAPADGGFDVVAPSVAYPDADRVGAHDHTNWHTHGPAHDHAHNGDAASMHSHGIGPTHAHAIPGADGEPVTWRRLVGLGVFGGMLPCPSAIVVMLSAIALHRVAFGLLLIVAFSVGLAAVLTAIGFVVVFAGRASSRVPILRRIIDRAHERGALWLMARALPVVAALAVTAAGALITLRALVDQGTL